MPRAIRTGRHPHEVAVCLAAMLLGLIGSVQPDTQPTVYAAFGTGWGHAFFVALVVFSAITLLGIYVARVDGLLTERIGIAVSSLFFALWSVAILLHRDWAGLPSTILPTLLATAGFWRARQITTDLRALRTHLLEDEW